MLHKDVLNLLFPCELGGDHQLDMEVEGTALDRAMASALQLRLEMFPDTTELLLERWEKVYGIIPDPAKPLFQRQQLLRAKYNARGGISRRHLQAALRPFVGYDVEIEEYHVARCDDPNTLTDDQLFALDPALIWQFRIYIDNTLLQTAGYNPADIQRIINEMKPAHTQGILDTGTAGFFCDNPDSLTDLTFLAL